MNTMKWLLRREFWEHKGAMLWAPLFAAALILVATGGMMAWGMSQGQLKGNIMVKFKSGNEVNVADVVATIPDEQKEKIARDIASGFLATSAPLFVMMGIIIFFYCLNTLSEERRDRSILFWKSLPVSDGETVASKVATALLVIPLITIAVAVFMSVLLLLLAGILTAFHGINMFGAVLGTAELYLSPFRLISLLPVYIIWALPTIGWLMLVSSWAKSKVFLWAVVAPLIVMAIFKWANFLIGGALDADWLWNNVIGRALAGVMPGIWIPYSGMARGDIHGPAEAVNQFMVASYTSLATPHAIIGAVAGIAMIYGAIRMRRWKDEG